jgi:hypothetical protein
MNSIYPSQNRKRWPTVVAANNEISGITKYTYGKYLE